MNLAGKLFSVGDVEIDALQVCVRRGGQERHLRHQTFDVLLYLLEQRHRLVTKDELIEAVWGDTIVTENALVQCIAEIRRALGDDPHHPRFIKTFSKAGYRFIGEVEEQTVEPPPLHLNVTAPSPLEKEVAASGPVTSGLGLARHHEPKPPVENPSLVPTDNLPAPSAPPQPMRSKPRLRWGGKRFWVPVACSLFAVVVLGITVAVRSSLRSAQSSEMTLPNVPGKRALAVMYFDDHSDRKDLNWLREGLADMLITDLARSERLTVLSRQQLYLLLERIGHSNGGNIRLDEALDIARRTHADAVLLGSFSAFGEQIRIDAQLYDVNTGQLAAADQLVVNKPGEILTEIDGLALKLEGHLGTRMAHEAGLGFAGAMTDNLEAYRYYSLGVAKAQAFENAPAVELLAKAVELDPKFAMAYARIGYAYAVTDFVPDKGRPYLEKALQLSAPLSEKDKLSIRAWYAISKSDYPEAIRLFREIITRYPSEIEAYWRLGRLLQGEERPEEGIAVLKQGLTVDPEAKELYNTLGVNYLTSGKYSEAIAAHERYVELAPREPNAHDSHGMSLQQSGRYDEAIVEYNAALALDPEFEPAIVHLGDTYFQQGRYHDAIGQYQRYINVTHSDSARSIGYGNIALVELRKGDIDRAEQAAANEMRYGHGAPWSSLLVAVARNDRSKVARLKNLLVESSSFSERGARKNVRTLKYFEGYAELNSGDSRSAIEDLKEALRHLPPTSGIDLYEDCLANAYLELGRLDDAVDEYERISRLNPNYPLLYYHLAQAYARKGDREKSSHATRKFLSVWRRADSNLPEIVQAKKTM